MRKIIDKDIWIRRRLWPLLFLTGVLTGVFLVQMQEDHFFSDIFHEYFLKQYVSAAMDHKKMFWCIGAFRIGQYALMTGCGMLSIAVCLIGIWICGLGLIWGMMIRMSASCLGMRGIMICVMGLFPQIIFYIPAFGWILLWIQMRGSNRKKYILLSAAGFFFLILGIIAEACVNPMILQSIL